jgi:hypothetical protein
MTSVLPKQPPLWWTLTALLLAASLIAIGCASWMSSYPGPGDRPLTSTTILAGRLGAGAMFLAAHVILTLVVLPALVRPQPIYRTLAGAMSILGALCATGWVALRLAA